MSSPEKTELKAGHPPAIKVGGMRVKGARVHEEKLSKEDIESPWEGEHAKESSQAVIVAGAVTHGDKDFTPAAVKVAHEKPVPTAAKPVPNKQINRPIQQPR